MANDNTFGKQGYQSDNVIGGIIGDNVSIGPGSVILPKVIIHDNAVVGAGSVVTKDVHKNSLVLGIPAKHVKFLDEIINDNNQTL